MNTTQLAIDLAKSVFEVAVSHHPGRIQARHRFPRRGLERFLAVARGRQVYALGGVTPTRHHELAERGGAGSAVLGDLFGQPSPRAAAERLTAYYSLAKTKISGS